MQKFYKKINKKNKITPFNIIKKSVKIIIER